MITDAETQAPKYAETGASSVTFHFEAATDPVATAAAIRSNGARAAVAVKPGTPITQVLHHLDAYDMILLMTVEPGFGGQSFMPEVMPKLADARAAVDASGLDVWLEVDGGIAVDTVPRPCAAAPTPWSRARRCTAASRPAHRGPARGGRGGAGVTRAVTDVADRSRASRPDGVAAAPARDGSLDPVKTFDDCSRS